MTTTPSNASSNISGKPPIVDRATWQAARDELLVREKAHTREGDAIAAARRRLPMVEIDGTAEVTGANGSVPFLDLFQGRDELIVYHSMWYTGAPPQGQCEGCTFNLWHMRDAVYLNARGVSFAVLTSGQWDEVARYVEFMGYPQPWYSVRGVEASIATEEGHIVCYLRDGDRVFLTYSTTSRGNEPADTSLGLLDMTPYGRREAWEDNPEGWPAPPDAGSPAGGHGAPICWYWRTDADGVATWVRPADLRRNGPAPARLPWKSSAGRTTTTETEFRRARSWPRHTAPAFDGRALPYQEGSQRATVPRLAPVGRRLIHPTRTRTSHGACAY